MIRLSLAMAATLLLAACGTTSSPTPSTSAAAPSSAPPSTSSAPSASDAPSASSSTGASPSGAGASPSGSGLAGLPHVDPDLEARLPAEINGVTMQKLSMAGSTFLNEQNAETEAFRAALESAGASPEDVTLAVASAMNNVPLNVAAIRVAGTEASQFLQSFVDSVVAEQGGTATQVDIAGRQVVRITSPEDSLGDSYLVAIGDTVYQVRTPDIATATAALGLLPQS